MRIRTGIRTEAKWKVGIDGRAGEDWMRRGVWVYEPQLRQFKRAGAVEQRLARAIIHPCQRRSSLRRADG